MFWLSRFSSTEFSYYSFGCPKANFGPLTMQQSLLPSVNYSFGAESKERSMVAH